MHAHVLCSYCSTLTTQHPIQRQTNILRLLNVGNIHCRKFVLRIEFPFRNEFSFKRDFTFRTACFTMAEDENILKTLLEEPEDARSPDTFYFWWTVVFDDAKELARCQQSCMDKPKCYYYTFVSYSSSDQDWDGTCTGASSEHSYDFVVDEYAYSGVVEACEEIGKQLIQVLAINRLDKS